MTYDRATFTIVAEGDQYVIQWFENQIQDMNTDHLSVEVTDCEIEEGIDINENE